MWTYPFKEAGSCDRWRGVEWLLKLLFVCLSACPHLVDLFPPRSSRRPSPFLLQDAHSSSVHRSVHLQTPAAASVVSRHHLAPVHLIPAQPQKKKKERRKKGSPPEFTLHPRITDAFFTHLRNLALEWTPPENIDRSDVSSTNWTFTVRKEISERGVQAEDGSLMWGQEAETKDFLIQSCLLLNSSEKKKRKRKKRPTIIYTYTYLSCDNVQWLVCLCF